MICTHCGHSMPDGSLTCDVCGTYLGRYSTASQQETGVRAIRQGRVSANAPTLPSQQGRTREYGDYDLSSLPLESESPAQRRRPSYAQDSGSSRPDTRRGVPVKSHASMPSVKSRQPRVHGARSRTTNWMLIGVIAALVVIVAGAAYLVYMNKSDQGQRATARRNALSATEAFFTLAQNDKDILVQTEREDLLKKWNSVSPQAYWLAGQDYMDEGDVESAITCFRIGDVVDPDNYDGLLLLANAYELNMQDDQAEAIYLRMAQDISPFRTEAYNALIRMYQEQDRGPEAAAMMQTAYENTDKESFRLERKDYIPLSPEISLSAGRHDLSEMGEDIYLSSPQGYDIYYTLDPDAELPAQGQLAEDGKIVPEEGSITIRAVCVSGDLVSDPLTVSYTFYYPSPPAPKTNLAPGTYKKRYSVSLRPGDLTTDSNTKLTKKEQAEIESHYEYYYTIDGSTPTVESSPKYDGNPIEMPSGRVTLKAICVNQYGKSSSAREVSYKFDVKPYPLEIYAETDVFAGFILNKTSIDEFTATFGQPLSTVDSTYLSLTSSCRHLTYDWGYAVFILENNAWQLVRIEMNSQIADPPRGVGLGSTESEITAVYKDYGQKEGADGTRGLYYDYPKVGQVLISSDGTRYVQYSLSTATSKTWILQYWLGSNGRVNRIVHYYQP